jgi:MoaA/NifB/PqqE/SkfB family radical SAM enzyme
MEIVKAEILWTRKCRVGCEYCAMSTSQQANTFPVERWERGFDRLKELGCGFAAFYGAEPLQDFENLPRVVGYAESIGIHTTVITSGMAPDVLKKLDELHTAGAKSLSMSYDILPIGKGSEAKTRKAIEYLQYFRDKENIRDVAAIATLTRQNFRQLPESIENLTAKGIWTFFDFIHPDRGQLGSKCQNFPGIEKMLFTKDDIPELLSILGQVAVLKKKGYFCHTSYQFISLIDSDPDILLNFTWNCANEVDFPAWVTVDCDGRVYPCDDFQIYDGEEFYLDHLVDNWKEFKTYWKKKVKLGCSGCLWNTHLDAHFIKRGWLPFANYVHTDRR